MNLRTQQLFPRILSFYTQTAGIKNLKPPPKPRDVAFPEKPKLRVMEKVPQYPPGLKAFKMQKRLRFMRGPEEYHNTILLHKQFGIVALTGGRLLHGHFEMIRLTLGRKLNQKTAFAIWRVDAPWQPVTKKSLGQRMGGGKGGIHHYVTPLKAGRVIVEVAGTCEFFEVERAMQEVADKLPFPAKVVTQQSLDEDKAKEKWEEESNLHPWTWKYMIQNNIIGCHRWISPYDKLWFNKYR